MLLSLLFNEPLFFLAWVLAVVYALTVHEFSHAFSAKLLGDDTAKLQGRLTLNPLAHIDWVGFVMLVLIGFGWGKPVPFNPYNLKNQKFGPALISLSGPISNMLSAVVFGLILRFSSGFIPSGNMLLSFLSLLVMINLILAFFNLIPIPPLDGSKVLFSFFPLNAKFERIRYEMETKGPMILIIIIIIDSFLGIGIFSRILSYVINWVTGFIL
jgi:Zn-dependent protease